MQKLCRLKKKQEKKKKEKLNELYWERMYNSM